MVVQKNVPHSLINYYSQLLTLKQVYKGRPFQLDFRFVSYCIVLLLLYSLLAKIVLLDLIFENSYILFFT